jgi:hypothetical protein
LNCGNEDSGTFGKIKITVIKIIRTIAIETFKIINKKSPLYLHDLVQIKK